MTKVDDLLNNPDNLNLSNMLLICKTRVDGITGTYDGQHLYEAQTLDNNHYQVVAKTWDDDNQSFVDASLPVVEYQNGSLEFVDRDLNNVYVRDNREQDDRVNDSNAPYYLIRAWQAFVSHKYANFTYDTFIVNKDEFLQNSQSPTNPTNPSTPNETDYDLGTSKIKTPSKLDVDEDYQLNNNK